MTTRRFSRAAILPPEEPRCFGSTNADEQALCATCRRKLDPPHADFARYKHFRPVWTGKGLHCAWHIKPVEGTVPPACIDFSEI